MLCKRFCRGDAVYGRFAVDATRVMVEVLKRRRVLWYGYCRGDACFWVDVEEVTRALVGAS